MKIIPSWFYHPFLTYFFTAVPMAGVAVMVLAVILLFTGGFESG